MAEGSVGAVYLDLVVRDTVEKQVQAMAAKAQSTAKNSFTGMEAAISAAVEKAVSKASKSVEAAAASASAAAAKAASAAQQAMQAAAASASSCGQQVENTINKSFSKAVALAQARVNELERAFDDVGSKLDIQWQNGTFDEDSKATKKLLEQQEKLYARIEAARERLAIEVQAAAQKQAAAEESAAQRAAQAAEVLAAKQKEVVKQGTAPNPPPTEAIAPAVRESGAEAGQISFWKRLQSLASGFGSIASKAFSGAGKLARGFTGVLGGVLKRFTSVNKSTSSFGTRLKGIVSGALIFNGISAALRNVTTYLGSAIKSTDQMKVALANLQGAAKTAAAPIIEVVTPALVALANAAATALHYVAKLFSLFTGKSVSDMAKSAKAMDKTSQAASKMSKALAGFDEITKLSSGAGGASGSALAPNYGYAPTSTFLDTILDAVKAGTWMSVGQLISNKITESLNSINWQSIKSKAGKIAQDFAQFLNGLFATPDIWTSVGTTIAEGINTASTILLSWANTINWEDIGSGFAAGLNSLVSTIDWAEAGKAISDTTIGLLNSITTAIEEIEWQDIGNAIAEFVGAINWGGVIEAILEGVMAAVVGLSQLLIGIFEPAWDELVNWWGKVAYEDGQFTIEGLLKGIGDSLIDVYFWLEAHVFDPIVNGVKKLFGIHSPSTVMEEIGGYLAEGFLNGFEQIVEWIKGCINGVIGFINDMISAVCDGINFVIKALNKLSFDIPDWVPVVGGESWGFNIRTIAAPEIPMLANGGIIKQPTLAMMGEYAGAKSNPEIAAPQSLIEESVANVMHDLIDSNIAGFEAIIEVLQEILEAVLGIEIGDDVIGNAVERYQRKMRNARGEA